MNKDNSGLDFEFAERSTVSLEECHLLTKTLTFRLARLQANLNTQAADLLRRHGGVPLAHWRVLVILHQHLATKQKEIVDRAQLDKGQVSRIVERLINEGLLVSESDIEDKRVLKVHLTSAGHEMMSRLLPVMGQRLSHLLSPFSDEEVTTLFEFRDRLDGVSGKLESQGK